MNNDVTVSINLRIKWLASQAEEWAQKMTWSSDPRFGDRCFSDLYDEKFAELIVKACLNVADGHGAYEVMDSIIDKFDYEPTAEQ